MISEIANVNKNIIVVLQNGGLIEMPWIGDGGGCAVANILFGLVNPSGHFAESFPISLTDMPTSDNFPCEDNDILYHERFYIGYRFYDKYKIDVLFHFCHGLSYTTFNYKNLRIENLIIKIDSNSLL